MVEISNADLDMMYKRCICMHNGRVVFVKDIGGRTMYMKDLESEKQFKAEFDVEQFGNLKGRIGFVNRDGHAIYTTRIPLRKYCIGISKQNVSVKTLQGWEHTAGDSRYYVESLQGKEWAHAINNDYPSLAVAAKAAKNTNGSCAFDRQFAIDCNRTIYYRTKPVGELPARTLKACNIVFTPEYTYLSDLIEPDYEKTVRTFTTA